MEQDELIFRTNKINNENNKHIILDTKYKNAKYGIEPHKRNINEYIQKGIVIINKPNGPTSHEVASFVKKILQIKKVGHSGSLDPRVTGVQPIMLSKATKAIRAIRLTYKEYVCYLKLHHYVSEDKIRSIILEFIGSIYQVPPIKSAVKRRLRKRCIYSINILEISKKNVLLQVCCEAGTYIRKLCHDIGLALGVGGNMQELVRSRVGPFEYKDSITLQKLTDAYDIWISSNDDTQLKKVILPMEKAFSNLSSIIVKDSAIKYLSNGSILTRPGIISLDSNIKKDEVICLFTQKKELISLSKSLMYSEEIINCNYGFVAKPIAIFINPIKK